MSALPTSVVYVAQVVTSAVYAYDYEASGFSGWYRGTARVTTNAGVAIQRTQTGHGPERAIAFALEKIAQDLLQLHPRKEIP